MKIKQSLFVLLIVMPLVTVFGQKVKVKKEVLFINKKEVGFFVAEKVYQWQKQFAVLNHQRDTIFKVGSEVVFSVLDGEDEIYQYESFSIPSKQIKKSYPVGNGYNLRPKTVIQHFISKGIIDVELNLNESRLSEFEQNLDELPEDFVKALEKEKKEMSNIDFISDKVKDGKISLKKVSTTSKYLGYLYRSGTYYFDEYEIYSKNETTKLLIGKLIIRYPLEEITESDLFNKEDKAPKPLSGDISKGVIFVYNNKGGRVSRLGKSPLGSLKVYNGEINKKSIKHGMFEEKSILSRATKMIDWLISYDKM